MFELFHVHVQITVGKGTVGSAFGVSFSQGHSESGTNIDKDRLEIGASSLQPPLSNMLSDRHQGRSFPRSANYHRPPYARYWSTLAANHPSTSEKPKKNENERCFLCWGLKLSSSSCSPVQNSSKLDIFGNFVAGRSAGPFVGRHFLLERHFAGEMISVGKVVRRPTSPAKLHYSGIRQKCDFFWTTFLLLPIGFGSLKHFWG